MSGNANNINNLNNIFELNGNDSSEQGQSHGRKPDFNLHNNRNEWVLALIFGLLFFVLGAPFIYSFSHKMATSLGFSGFLDDHGVVTIWGTLFHAALAILLSYFVIRTLIHFYPNGFRNRRN